MEATIPTDGDDSKALSGVEQAGDDGGAAKVEVISEEENLDREVESDSKGFEPTDANEKILRKNAVDNPEDQGEVNNIHQEAGIVQAAEKKETALLENREEFAEEAVGKENLENEAVGKENLENEAVKEKDQVVKVDESTPLVEKDQVVDKMVPVAEDEEQLIEIKEATDGFAASQTVTTDSSKNVRDDDEQSSVLDAAAAEVEDFNQEKSAVDEQTPVLPDQHDEVPVPPTVSVAASETMSRDSIAANGGGFDNTGTAEKTKSGLRRFLSWCLPDLDRFDTHAWASGLALGIIVTCSAIIISKKLENKGTSGLGRN